MGNISINITAENVAWYGAIVATLSFVFSFILGALAYLRDSAKVKVKKTEGFLAFGPELSEIQIFLEAINTGRRTITLTGAGLSLGKKGNLIFPNPNGMQFPYELLEGKSTQLWSDKEELLQQLGEKKAKIKYAWFRDATGKIYKSKCKIENKK